MAEALRANIGPTCQFDPKFHQPFSLSGNWNKWSFKWYKKSGQNVLFCHNPGIWQTDGRRRTASSSL